MAVIERQRIMPKWYYYIIELLSKDMLMLRKHLKD